MLTSIGPPWKRTGCLVWSPRTSEMGTAKLLGVEDTVSAALDSSAEEETELQAGVEDWTTSP